MKVFENKRSLLRVSCQWKNASQNKRLEGGYYRVRAEEQCHECCPIVASPENLEKHWQKHSTFNISCKSIQDPQWLQTLIPFIQSTAQRKIISIIHLLLCCKPAAPKEKARGERALSNLFYCTAQGIKYRREMPKAGEVFAGVRVSPLQEPCWHQFIWGRGTGNDQLLKKLFTERAWIVWIIIQTETQAVMWEYVNIFKKINQWRSCYLNK